MAGKQNLVIRSKAIEINSPRWLKTFAVVHCFFTAKIIMTD